MKFSRFRFHRWIALGLSFTCGMFASALFAGEPAPAHTLKVLFIGNSYIYVNDLPALITQLAITRGVVIEHESVTPGGTTLAKHWADGIALQAIRKQHWDFVVLQEQANGRSSIRPA